MEALLELLKASAAAAADPSGADQGLPGFPHAPANGGVLAAALAAALAGGAVPLARPLVPLSSTPMTAPAVVGAPSLVPGGDSGNVAEQLLALASATGGAAAAHALPLPATGLSGSGADPAFAAADELMHAAALLAGTDANGGCAVCMARACACFCNAFAKHRRVPDPHGAQARAQTLAAAPEPPPPPAPQLQRPGSCSPSNHSHLAVHPGTPPPFQTSCYAQGNASRRHAHGWQQRRPVP